eukprot:Plantae.Rhodophyta-Palmaria_palmata.ctg28625.p1 GENE.Plantae.Rhodophyta-Palmaria_palmata.ctg28625~~Plantae.Rhodophyta-Palmaria_palmata.ctg28625.p1  ORF type:complete len:146 (+),score=26.88 Plantae.Rhodophyta-Palmaria_palmata.ctg28625:30-440(+)
MGAITIFLDKCTNLKDADGIGKSDPYVKFHLEQDNVLMDKNYGKQTSTHKSNTCNPVYGETFTFSNVPTLKNLVLWVTVMDDDIGRDDKLGKCKINLDGREDIKGNFATIIQIVGKGGRMGFRKDSQIHLKIKWDE